MKINEKISTYGRAEHHKWELDRSLPINFVHNGNEYKIIRFHADISLEYDSKRMMLIPECSTEMSVYIMDLKQKMIYEIDLEDVEIQSDGIFIEHIKEKIIEVIDDTKFNPRIFDEAIKQTAQVD